MTFLEASVLFVVTIATRLPFLLASSSDKATQIWIIDAFARARRIAGLHFPDSLRQGRIAYPPLPHFLISFLPGRLWSIAAAVFNIGCDVVHVLIVYAVMLVLTGSGGTALSASFAAALLFATLPILHPINARLAGAGSRTLGPLLATGYFLCIMAFLGYGSVAAAVLALPLAVLVVLSSQFALQVLVAFSIIGGLFWLSIWPVLILAAAIALAAMLPFLDVRGQLRAKLQHYAWYGRARNLHIDARNSLSEMRRILAGGAPAALKLPLYLVAATTPGVVVLGTGTMLLALALYWPGMEAGAADHAVRFSLGVAGAAAIAALLTMRGPLKIFGEAERYVEYATPWLAFLLAAVLPSDDRSIAVLLALATVNVALTLVNFISLMLRQLMQNLDTSPDRDLRELADFLDRRWSRTVIANPIVLHSALSLAATNGHRYLQLLVADEKRGLDHWETDLAGYPHIRGEAAWFTQKYGADTFVFDRSSLKRFCQLSPDQDILALPRVFENETYVVHETDKRS